MQQRIIKPFEFVHGELKLSVGCDSKNEVLSTEVEQPNLDEYIGLDNRDRGQHIVWDVLEGIPLTDNSCSHIWASHVIEHFDAAETQWVMEEFWRVLREGGTLELRAPHLSSSTAYLPQHKQQLTEHYFNFFTSPNVKNYGLHQWEVEISRVYHRKGSKYDIQVIMHPLKSV